MEDISTGITKCCFLDEFHQRGKKSFITQGFPNTKNEKWKYTKIKTLNIDDFVFSHNDKCECSCLDNRLKTDAYEIKFCNGKLCDKNCCLPDEIKVMSLLNAIENKKVLKYLIKDLNLDDYPFAALNSAYLEQGVFIKVCKGYKANKPLALVYHVNADKKYFCNLHNIIVAEDNSKIDIVEYFFHTGEIKAQYFNNIVNEIYIGNNATLGHYKFQNDAFKSFHVALNYVYVQSDGKYNSLCLQKGADLARNETVVKLLEKNAEAVVNAVYTINGWACSDITTDIEHLSSNTTSSQLIKGVVGGNAKGVFQGKIHIAPEAIKTTGYQLHKALLLSDESEVDVKPELEIFADDVKCSHGSTCGEIDKEQMFYLRSRGITEEDAKNILIDAFLEEPMSCIDNTYIKDWIQSLLK